MGGLKVAVSVGEMVSGGMNEVLSQRRSGIKRAEGVLDQRQLTTACALSLFPMVVSCPCRILQGAEESRLRFGEVALTLLKFVARDKRYRH